MEFAAGCIYCRQFLNHMKLLLIPVLFIAFSCTQKEKKTALSRRDPAVPVVRFTNYDSCKKQVLVYKQRYRVLWPGFSKPQKEAIFISAVTETIIPGWIGTPWTFNGTSEIPQKGSIACGYFVTTVLRDAGLGLARIRLAQCASEQMIVSLIQSKYIQRFRNAGMGVFMRSLEQQGYGLYIVGLDNHTGFIYNDGEEIYFIHSTFVGTGNVQKEKAFSSVVLRQSKYKVLGKLSADEKLLNRWIN